MQAQLEPTIQTVRPRALLVGSAEYESVHTRYRALRIPTTLLSKVKLTRLAVYRVRGRITRSAALVIQRRIDVAMSRARCSGIVLDVRDVVSITPTAAAKLREVKRTCADANLSFLIVRATPLVRKVCRNAGLGRTLARVGTDVDGKSVTKPTPASIPTVHAEPETGQLDEYGLDVVDPTAPIVLVVDTHEDNIEVVATRLKAWGYSVMWARNGHAALKAISESSPALILIEVMMPIMSGIDVVRILKNDRALPFIPIIIVSALDSTEDKEEAFEAGADDYVTKPIDFRELKARIAAMLRIKRQQDAQDEREHELLEVNERLHFRAQTDSLTGVDNRGAFEMRLDAMLEHAVRLNEPVACLLLDVDNFKWVNDTYGHHAGDDVLQQIAALATHHAREIDRVARYGGDEFAILLPGADHEYAMNFAESVRAGVEKHEFVTGIRTIRRTISVGVAIATFATTSSPKELTRLADAELYTAKGAGKNRVCG